VLAAAARIVRGSLLLTQASVGGSYFGDIFFGCSSANDGANPLLVLTEGFQSAFVACVVLGRPRKAPQEPLEAIPVPIQ
jgi:hypothetical protein